MDFGVLVFFVIVAFVVRALVRSVNTVKSNERRQQVQQIVQRMRATAQQTRPGFRSHRVRIPARGRRTWLPAAAGGPTGIDRAIPATTRSSARVDRSVPTAAGREADADRADRASDAGVHRTVAVGRPMDPTPRPPASDVVVVAVTPESAQQAAFSADEPSGTDTDPTSDAVEGSLRRSANATNYRAPRHHAQHIAHVVGDR